MLAATAWTAVLPARPLGGADRADRASAGWFAPLVRAPLDGALVVTGGFGDYRGSHFHAGFDFGTGGRVGRPVYATLDGWIERVRTSGVGYGRSLYLHSVDGRLLVFGHLDAFEPAIAAFVAARQESTGQYEQDLWPEAGRFRVRAGQRIAWSGESGAGPPHLHFEIRRGDVAYHPLRAGLTHASPGQPRLASLTLEPIAPGSLVARRASPRTIALSAAPETVLVEGKVRAVVHGNEGGDAGTERRQPWSMAIEIAGATTECRFDSVSWATDMVETDEVYDAGRVVGRRGIVLWAPAGQRPRVLRSSAPLSEEAGAIEMRPGDPPRTLAIVARDPGGEETRRAVVLRAPGPSETGPDTASSFAPKGSASADPRFEMALLPGDALRVSDDGAPLGSRGVTVNGVPATSRAGVWSAVLPLERVASREKTSSGSWARLEWMGRDARGRPWLAAESYHLRRDGEDPDSGAFLTWSVPRESVFEPGVSFASELPTPGAPNPELVPRSRALRVMPESRPLKSAIPVSGVLSAVSPPAAEGERNLALYRRDGSSWRMLSTTLVRGRLRAESGGLGTFAVFSDTMAPRLLRLRTHRAPAGPYSRWALEARLIERGSGVAARESYFEVDGARVPSEWDDERGVLRWRPLRRPAGGRHRYTLIATDRAGNRRVSSGTFVLD